MADLADNWAAAAAYENFMGRWSRRLAPRFVAWLRVGAGAHWLDVGCGTGALTDAICRSAEPASVRGCDPAAPFVEYAQRHIQDVRASFVVARSGGLPRRDGGYDSISSLLAFNFFPDPAAAVQEMRSLAAQQATVSACVWDYAGGMELLRRFWDAAVAIDPAARDLDEGARFPLCRPDALTDVFRTAGLGDVRCEPLEIRTEFPSLEDYWRPMLAGTGPAPSYIATLDVHRRTALAQRIERAFQPSTAGTIALTARAWAVRGTVG